MSLKLRYSGSRRLGDGENFVRSQKKWEKTGNLGCPISKKIGKRVQNKAKVLILEDFVDRV